MRYVFLLVLVLSSLGGCSRGDKYGDFRRAVLELAAEEEERKGNKQKAHELRNEAAQARRDFEEWQRSQSK